MKINEPLALVAMQIRQKETSVEQGFDQLIYTPTKQNSGDEYYWQHQSQLQQSNVHFDAPTLMEHTRNKSEQNLKETKEEDLSTRTTKMTNEQAIPKQFFSSPNQNTKSHTTELKEWVLGTKKEVSTSYLVEKAVDSASDNKYESKSQKALPAVSKERDILQFKNHHLFLEHTEAEMTLNLQQFTANEQKEVTQLLREHLKKNGLVLKKLIINGEKND